MEDTQNYHNLSPGPGQQVVYRVPTVCLVCVKRCEKGNGKREEKKKRREKKREGSYGQYCSHIYIKTDTVIRYRSTEWVYIQLI